MKEEVYVSVDVEADGPIPGPHSMLSLGAAAFTADGKMLGTFSDNLELLEGAVGHPDTMQWWKTQPEAWASCRKSPKEPSAVMTAFAKWVQNLPGKPVFIGYPATYDFMFTYWYLIKFTGASPFSHSGLDIKTFAMFMMGTDYRASTKKRMPARWFSNAPHTHVAVADAIEQGQLFINMLKEHKGIK